MKKIITVVILLSIIALTTACSKNEPASAPKSDTSEVKTQESKTETTSKASEKATTEKAPEKTTTEKASTEKASTESTTTAKASTEKAATENKKISLDKSNMKLVGDEKYGYTYVPKNWVKFQDLGGSSALQYSDPLGQAIVSFNIFGYDKLTDEQKKSFNTDELGKSVWVMYESNDVNDIQGARTKFLGYDAIQLLGRFVSEDQSIPSIIACWAFKDDKDVYRYISIEAPKDNIIELIPIIEELYTLKKPE